MVRFRRLPIRVCFVRVMPISTIHVPTTHHTPHLRYRLRQHPLMQVVQSSLLTSPPSPYSIRVLIAMVVHVFVIPIVTWKQLNSIFVLATTTDRYGTWF